MPNIFRLGAPSAVCAMRAPQPVSSAACASIPKGLTPRAWAARLIVGSTWLTNWLAVSSSVLEGVVAEAVPAAARAAGLGGTLVGAAPVAAVAPDNWRDSSDPNPRP